MRVSFRLFNPLTFLNRMCYAGPMNRDLVIAGQRFRALSQQFTAFGDPMRQQLFFLIASEKLTVQELANRLGIPRPTVSHHLKVLREAGLIEDKMIGVKRYYLPTLGPVIQDMRALIVSVESLRERFHLHDKTD